MTKRNNAVSRGGRPPRREGERLSKNRTFRIRGLLDEQLQNAASQSGRSVSEEIEYQLGERFRSDPLERPASADLFRALSAAMWLIENETGKKWNEDFVTAVQLSRMFDTLVLAIWRKRPLSVEDAYKFREAAKTRPMFYLVTGFPPDMEFKATTAVLEVLHKMRLGPSREEIDAYAASLAASLAPSSAGILGNFGQVNK